MRVTLTFSLLMATTVFAQTEMTIAEMQTPGTFGADSAGTAGQLVTVEGIALSSSEHFYSGSHSSFYLIDAEGGDYGGVLVYHPDPDVFDVYVGDHMTVTGVVSEYYTNSNGVYSNMTEIIPENPDVDINIINFEQPLPDPVYVDMWYLDPIRQDDHVGEIYEGMLVEIEDAVVVDNSAPPSWRQFTVADPDGNQTVIRTAAYTLGDYGRPPLGASFELIRGVIYQVYGNYNVMPRDIDDIILAVGPPIISGTTVGPCGVTPSDMISVACNISDNTAVDEAFVHFRVNGGDWLEYSLSRDTENPVRFYADLPAQAEGSLVELYIRALDDELNESMEPAGGPDAEGFPAIYVSGIDPTTCAEAQGTTYADGSSAYQCHTATLTGVITFGASDFGFTEEDTYRNYILADADGQWNAMYIYNNQSQDVWLGDLERGDEITITGEITEYNGLTELTYITDFTLLSSGNEVNSTMTTIEDVFENPEAWESVMATFTDVTITEDAGFGEWFITDGSGETFYLDNLGVWDHVLEPGMAVTELTGMITYNFSNWKIAPRTNDDFAGLDVDETVAQPLAFELTGASPNPFNPATRLSFTLDRAANVNLAVYNLAGQRVAQLLDAPLAAGEHNVTFDGSALASGVYIARAEAADQSRQLKLLLVK